MHHVESSQLPHVTHMFFLLNNSMQFWGQVLKPVKTNRIRVLNPGCTMEFPRSQAAPLRFWSGWRTLSPTSGLSCQCPVPT